MGIDKRKFQNLLHQRRDELTDLLESEAAGIVELDQSKVGRLSRMDALQSQAMALETQRRAKVELVKIDIALKKFEQEEYGYCDECDEAINSARLEIDPATPLCIGCAAALENDR